MTSPSPDPTTDTQWLKITLLCPLPLLESAADLMAVLSGSGVEQTPETASGAYISGFFQLAARSNDDQVSPHSADQILEHVHAQMTELFALYNCTPPQPTTTLLADEDWAISWQQYFKPFEIVPGLVIKPSWEHYQQEPGQHILELDPGMAFGTGQHASTRMALAFIAQCMREQAAQAVLDVGTGTGILAMAAALFGAQRIIAIDNDPDAVTVARENIVKNRLDTQIETSTTPVEQIQGSYQLVCANIVHDVLVTMAPILTRLTAPGGHLILAGILSGEQEKNIIAVYAQAGMTLRDRQYQDEWVSLLLTRQE
jgi:ribosomal protein L11 methyltransferase